MSHFHLKVCYYHKEGSSKLGILSDLPPLSLVDMLYVTLEVLVLMVPLPPCGTPLWGSFACLNFGPCYLIFFLSLSWVLSFYKV